MKQTATDQQNQSKASDAVQKIKKIVSSLDESEKATLELLLDKEAQEHIKKSKQNFERGEFITLDEFKKHA